MGGCDKDMRRKEMTKKYLRTTETVMEDFCLKPLEMDSVRFKAIFEVLRLIPKNSYKKLADNIDNFEWFVPPVYSLAMVHPFFLGVEEGMDEGGKIAHHALVLYLSPFLEETEWDVVKAVVAHELAHLALGHKLFPSKDNLDRQEKEAFELVCKWGFKKEAFKHRNLQKRKGIKVG